GYEVLEDPEKRKRIVQALGLIAPKASRTFSRSFRPEDHLLPSLERIKEARKKLSGNVQYVKGVGPAVAAKLDRAGIRTIDDLLTFFPTRYDDRRFTTKIGELKEGQNAVVVGEATFAGVAFYRGLRRRVYEAAVEDGTGQLKLKWFHFVASSMGERIKRGQKLIVSGKVRIYRNQVEMHHPECEVYSGTPDSISFGRIVPLYREVGGLYQKTLRKFMNFAVTRFCEERACLIPTEICRKHDLLAPWKAILEMHLPDRIPMEGHRTEAARALAFEELFFYAFSLGLRKRLLKGKPGIAFRNPSPRFERMMHELPFELTGAQKIVLQAIRKDMASESAMNRLLQGDVGSGKTIVAFLAALVAIDHGYQVAFMAPTEILAEQHFRTLSAWAQKTDIRVEMLIGRQSAGERRAIIGDLAAGKVHLVVGTHALLESDVQFAALGFVVVDEQHRFGVRQRAVIRAKAVEPDVLVMSATPIPRTLALTLYGDLDVSILNELPEGRKPIETKLFSERDRGKVYEWVRGEIKKGRQAYVVYPLVDPSDQIDLKDATTMAVTLQKEIFPEFRVGLVHGQLHSREKEEWMGKFVRGEIDILVSTTIIEVGIDVANATVMVIEHPERFGLSQLHQLRGRVGRGSERSACLLVRPSRISQMARDRLQTFAGVHDGFLLAEEDLRLRGPGDFFGVAQSGFPTFAAAVFPRDLDLLETARREAFEIIQRDPSLSDPQFRHLKWVVDEVWVERLQLVRVG
ncbi:MAG TPA: ATP-dependent DNA helicase RecG, partial [Bdellovibrionota bacterium]|nr:ATP-dependent DNA helicase RecG [Bdellovibrionota bacterium]